MDLNSIVALAQAGFTREQIYQLANAPQPQPQPMQPQVMPQMQPVVMPQMQPQVIPQMQPVAMPQMQQPQVMPQLQQPVAAPQMQQPQQQTPQQTPQGTDQQKDPFMMLFEQMTGIKKAIQDNNISNSQIAGAEPQSTDDILASIIQPTKPKEDK